ncbi:hypothetical protein LJC74_07305 [Eubacteriales bacterium OttesenSCG-928-A19]|nr:hypothetical protein [Eubacteriales bacterium OttesenSCG-928-A19]
MKVILIEIVIVAVVWLVLRLLRGKITFFRGGYAVRKDSYMQDEKKRMLVEDTHFFRGKERESRSVRMDGTGIVQSRIPLDKNNKALMAYSYCAPMLSMVKGLGNSIRRALVLGGAGCTVPLYIAQNYEGAKVDVVEINAESIRIAKEYFVKEYAGENGPIQFIQEDAKDAVKKLEPGYQFIFCDLFIGGQPVALVYDDVFMKDLSRLAGENGMLVVNGGSLPMVGVRVVLAAMVEAFSNAWAMLLGNEGFVLVASNRGMPAMDNLVQNAQGVIGVYPSQLTLESLAEVAAERERMAREGVTPPRPAEGDAYEEA